MSIKNRLSKQIKKVANNKANSTLRKTIFRLARQRDILGLVVIGETILLVVVCILFFVHIL